MFKKINVVLEEGFNVPLPDMVKIKQIFPSPEISDIELEVNKQLKLLNAAFLVKPDQTIAIAVGSRGIANLSVIVESLVRNIKEFGAKPIIVPAMGSHGGACAEGQKDILAHYGITEESMGVPVVSSMDVVQIGSLEGGYPVFFDKVAYDCDAVIPVNRIKPHTDYKGSHESGLLKMLSIGLGNHKGAKTIHNRGFGDFHHLIPALGKVILKKVNVLFGFGIIENAYDKTAYLYAIRSEEIFEEEIKLNELAKSLMPKFHMSEIDLLVVDEIGKDISGSGMDPNITGRCVSNLPGLEAPPIKKIVVLGLTEKTRGNAVGIGLADVTTLKLVNDIDLSSTYANIITATELIGAKIPLFMNNDREAIAVAAITCNKVDLPEIKIVRIKNTLEMGEIQVSTTLLQELKSLPNIKVLSEPVPMRFTEDGMLF